jgi:nucleoside-diphosphate-sugar epimerase
LRHTTRRMGFDCVVRPFNVMGRAWKTDYRVMPNSPARLRISLSSSMALRQTRSFCYVQDDGRLCKALLHRPPGHAYNIGNPTPEISIGLADVLRGGRPA